MSLKYSWRIFLCTSGGDEFLVSNVHLNISSFKLNSHCSAAKPWRQKKIGPRIFNELTKQRILPAFIVPDMRHDLMRDILPVLYHYVVTKYHPTNTNRHFDQFVSFSKIVLMTQYTHFVRLISLTMNFATTNSREQILMIMLMIDFTKLNDEIE